jgi:hypothetical protein
MKQEYKDLMVNYLNTKENVSIRSFPGGWGGNKFEMDGRELGSNDRVPYLINKGMLEHAIINRFLNGKLDRGFTSYKFAYNKESQQFEGKLKNRVNDTHSVLVNLHVPDNIWFTTIDFDIRIKSKKEVTVRLTLNVRNGMFPQNIDETLNEMRQDIQSSVLRQIKDIKGRVNGSFAQNLSYSKEYNIPFNVYSIHHEKKDMKIPIL